MILAMNQASPHKKITKNIKKYCKLRGMNYSELARRANIPLTTLQNFLYRNNRYDPRITTIELIAKALKIKVDDLLK